MVCFQVDFQYEIQERKREQRRQYKCYEETIYSTTENVHLTTKNVHFSTESIHFVMVILSKKIFCYFSHYSNQMRCQK